MSAQELENATWRKSTFSGQGGDCIEVADGLPDVIPVRDSKDPEGPALLFPADAWTAVRSERSGRRLPDLLIDR